MDFIGYGAPCDIDDSVVGERRIFFCIGPAGFEASEGDQGQGVFFQLLGESILGEWRKKAEVGFCGHSRCPFLGMILVELVLKNV